MEKETKLFIIPNEEILEESEECFERTLNSREYHIKYIQEFSDKYNLGYHYTKEDSNIAPVEIANDGHFVIKTNCDFLSMVVMYIPEEITSRQRKWFANNFYKFSSYSVICCHSYYSDEPYRRDLEIASEVKQEIENKYQIYESRKDERDVRKKI